MEINNSDSNQPVSITKPSLNTDSDTIAVETVHDENYHRSMSRTHTGTTPSDLGFEQKEKIRTIFKIPVKDGVTVFNILAIPLVPLTVMLLSTYLNAQVIFLLSDPAFFDVPDDKIGYVSGILIFVSLPGAIVGTFFVGYLFDILGRRITLFVSFFIGSILLAIIPWTKPNVLPWLLLVRVII